MDCPLRRARGTPAAPACSRSQSTRTWVTHASAPSLFRDKKDEFDLHSWCHVVCWLQVWEERKRQGAVVSSASGRWDTQWNPRAAWGARYISRLPCGSVACAWFIWCDTRVTCLPLPITHTVYIFTMTAVQWVSIHRSTVCKDLYNMSFITAITFPFKDMRSTYWECKRTSRKPYHRFTF